MVIKVKTQLVEISLHFSSRSLHELISNRRRKWIKQQQTEDTAVVYLMDCEWRCRTQRAASCLLSWRPCQRSPPRNRMSNQASRPSPRPDPAPLSPVYTNLTGKRCFELQTRPKERLRGKDGADDKTGREESVFTDDTICKWSVGSEALRTRSPRRRGVCTDGIRWREL